MTDVRQGSSRTQLAEPERGSQKPDNGVLGLGKELAGEITGDDVPGLAAEVAYHAIFAIPALLVVLVTLSAVIDNFSNFDLANRLDKIIKADAPESTEEILTALVENAVKQVDGGAATIGLAFSVAIAIWAGSNGVGALIKSFNRAYDASEARSFAKKKAVAILLTIVLGVVINLAFALWVFGGQIGGWMAREFEMGSTFDWVWNLSRFPVGVAVIVFMLAILYYYGPTVEQEFRWVLPGAVFSTVAWGLLVLGFSIYIKFANPGSAYGALGGVLVFLFFLYLTALIFVVGAEVNAVLACRHDELYQQSARMSAKDCGEDPVPSVTGRREAPETQPATARSLAVGVATVAGILAASFISRRN